MTLQEEKKEGLIIMLVDIVQFFDKEDMYDVMQTLQTLHDESTRRLLGSGSALLRGQQRRALLRSCQGPAHGLSGQCGKTQQIWSGLRRPRLPD